jgi:xylulokinase
MLFCGIDIGTTNLKVALYDSASRPAWIRSLPTPRSRDSLGTVTEASVLLNVIEALIVEGWQELGRPAPITAISTSGVGEDGVFVDADLAPMSASIPWYDQRATADAVQLATDIAATPKSGIGMDPTRAAPKWLWASRNLPQVSGARHWLTLTDFPLASWAGVPFISDTLASRTGCFDPVERTWIDPLLAAAHAPPLPTVLSAGQIVGAMQSLRLRQSGAVDENTLLVAGGHDHPVAAHAIHRLATDARVDSMGTANVIYGDVPVFHLESYDPLIAFMASIKGPGQLACLGVFEFTATVNQFPGGLAAVRPVLDLAEMPGLPGHAIVSDFADVRQLLEWATMNARRMLDRLGSYGVAAGPIFATGGWSRSRSLLELRASIFGEPVHAPEEKELSVLGAALLASKALGPELEFRTPIAVIEPRPDWVAIYDDHCAEFAA